MKVCKPPAIPVKKPKNYKSVFLAGSIEMGAAEDWQRAVELELVDYKALIYNPRRDDWDSTWVQSIHNAQFYHQVSWEMDHLEKADIKFFYFSPNTKSPITLMELGYALGSDIVPYNADPDIYKRAETIICCPEGFWRKGNVEIMAYRRALKCFTDLQEAVDYLKTRLEKKK